MTSSCVPLIQLHYVMIQAFVSSSESQHVVGHHIYTNVYGADPDLPEASEGDPRRLVPRQKWAWIYKYQHLYMPPLYGLLALKVIVEMKK